ncbi:MAG TPA: CopG family antitoxin [Thermoanaerobaculia bacterium]|nr:CopG family antitoxin [Thermoanaerobaculia bacterium]
MPKRKNLKPIPKFESEDAEREFWATHDSTDHVDWSRAKLTTFSRLRPTTQTYP